MDQQGPTRTVAAQEGNGQAPKPPPSEPKKVIVKMLRISRSTSDSDEEPDRERAYFVRARIDPPKENMKTESSAAYVLRTSRVKIEGMGKAHAMEANEKTQHMERVAAMVATGDYHVVPFGGLPPNRSKIMARQYGGLRGQSSNQMG